MSLDKALTYITKGLLLATIVIPPFTIIEQLFFPFVSGRVYIFRLLVTFTLPFWLLLIAKRPEFRPRLRNPIVSGTLLFLAGLIITGLLGVDPTRSFFSNIERADGIIQFSHWVIFFLMLISVFRTRKDWLVFLWAFVATASAVALYAWSGNEIRLAGVFNNPSYLAGFMIFSIGIAGILWTYIRKEHQGWTSLAIGGLILFFLATLIFTQTRGVYLGVTAGFILFTLLAIFFLRQERRITLAAAGISILILLGLGSVFAFKKSSFVTGNQILNRIADASDLANLGAARERYLGWIIAFESFKDKPLLGWGPENYDIAFNAHYNYLAAKNESWFDSSHNQLMDVLAEGGIVGFSLYLFWIVAIFYTAAKLLKGEPRDKLIGAILASTYLGFLVQGWFLFDTFPFYLGLFPLLGFAYYRYEKTSGTFEKASTARRRVLTGPGLYALAVILMVLAPFLVIENIWRPYQANHLNLEFNRYLNGKRYGEASQFFDRASRINSPYTNFDVGNQAGWSLLYFLDNPLSAENKEAVKGVWRQIVAREEKSLSNRPLDPQASYVLGRLYRRGYDYFGDGESLAKAETTLIKARELSPNRTEYVSELIDVMFLEGKVSEGEEIAFEYASTLPSPYSDAFLGNLYFAKNKYDLAMENYRKAESLGYTFWVNDQLYARFVVAAEKVKDYQAIVRLSQEYLDHRGPSGQVFFNQAAGYHNMGNKEEAQKAYLKAVNLDRSYEQYSSFFITK